MCPGRVIQKDASSSAGSQADILTVGVADGLHLSGLNLVKSDALVKSGAVGGNGIDISGSVTRNDLGLTDVSVSGFTNGLYVGDATSVIPMSMSPTRHSTTTLVPSSDGNASDPDLKYTITYRDGTQQAIQPFVAADGFVDSVRGRGLSIAIARNTGVITVEGQRFRPDYFVDEHDAKSRAWWEAHKDASGIAYRIVDANADGIPDYEVHSAVGVQIAYRLP